MKFLRNLVASIFGTLIALGLLFVLLVLIAAALGETEKVVVNANSVLEINLEIPIKDYAPKSDNPFDELFGFNDEKMGLNEILNAIENAKYDDKIKGISIETLGVNAGLAQTLEIRDKLKEFKETGKFVMAYADFYNQKSYYLASVADSVFVNPMGGVDFKGLASEVLFFSDFQDKTGFKMEVIRHGKYKSAVEPFLSNTMSDENREQTASFLQSIWNEMLLDVSESRNKTIEELNLIADNLGARNVKLAKENNIIDAAIYSDEYTKKLQNASQFSTDSDLEKISLSDYISTGKGRIISSATDRIAVIYAQGDIIYGKGDENFIGQELIIEALKQARKSSSVKAIVLRINSPGGSALASELIWREIELTKQEMPVVVSMGDLAASGGYYLACNAHYIFAEPTTITGSIGVFGTIPNVSELAKNIGINAEQVATNKGAKYSIFEPMTDEFRAVTTEGVEQVYTTFLERVANGRNKTVVEIDSIAQGRVWSGIEAVNNGLVDELGNLEDAIWYAADVAGITEFKVRNYPNYNVNFEDRFNALPFIKTKQKMLINELGEENYKIYQTLKEFSQVKGIQAKMPFLINIK